CRPGLAAGGEHGFGRPRSDLHFAEGIDHGAARTRRALSTMAPRMPTFILIGASKAGTTACYYHLKAHPEIFMSRVKEPRFFLFDGQLPSQQDLNNRSSLRDSVVDVEKYRQLFDGATTERALGEASTAYLHRPECAARIRAHVPDVRLIAFLRDPVER